MSQRPSAPGTITIASNKLGPPLRVNVKEDIRAKNATPTHSPRPLAIEGEFFFFNYWLFPCK